MFVRLRTPPEAPSLKGHFTISRGVCFIFPFTFLLSFVIYSLSSHLCLPAPYSASFPSSISNQLVLFQSLQGLNRNLLAKVQAT